MTKKENSKHCLEVQLPEDYFTQDHDTYLFFSAYSGSHESNGIPNEHIIHNVKFYDTLHLHDKEGQDTADEKREFHGRKEDMIRERVVKSDATYTVEAYN